MINAEQVNRDVDTLRKHAEMAQRNEDKTRRKMRALLDAVEDFLDASAVEPHLALNARYRLVQAMRDAGGDCNPDGPRARKYAAMPSEDR